jgi:hypothetical protein
MSKTSVIVKKKLHDADIKLPLVVNASSPVTKVPAVEAPVVKAASPVVKAASSVVKAASPVVEALVTEALVTEALVTEAPVTEAPVVIKSISNLSPDEIKKLINFLELITKVLYK